MRVIDCRSAHLTIQDYEPGNKYVALSYVWGQSGTTGPTAGAVPRARGTTKRTMLKLPADIPLTIRDAIEVTRALRCQYLWVDKYCIDQNNPEEQREQFSRMGDIYAGSHVAIFALGDDSNAGLPGVSSTPRLGQEEARSGAFRFISTMPDPHASVQQTKWNTRGWTYQEGLFSTRRLFFTDHQVYFECNAMN
ncbi:heterokaryon incompatibility protein-domain-containing protein, partial [Immersiella caudata]